MSLQEGPVEYGPGGFRYCIGSGSGAGMTGGGKKRFIANCCVTWNACVMAGLEKALANEDIPPNGIATLHSDYYGVKTKKRKLLN